MLTKQTALSSGRIVIYPVDSDIHPLNNPGLGDNNDCHVPQTIETVEECYVYVRMRWVIRELSLIYSI